MWPLESLAVSMFPLGAKTTLCGATVDITGIDMGIFTASILESMSMSTAKRMKPLGF